MAKRVSGRSFVVGAAVGGAGLLTEVVVTWVSHRTPPAWASAATTATTLVLAGLTAMFEKTAEGGERPASPQPAPPGYAQRPPARRGFGLGTALLVLLLVFGAGGLAVNYAVPKVVHALAVLQEQGTAPWDRPLGPATERLARPVSARSHNQTVRVTAVTAHAATSGVVATTVVNLSVHNDTDDTAHFPVFGSAQISVPGADTLMPDVDRGGWAGEVGARSDLTGSITFIGTPPAGAVTVTLLFAHFSSGFDTGTVKVALPLTAAP